MVDLVPDEYYERYRQLSHQQLYQMLRAGSPAQIDAVAGTWKSIVETAGGLAANLRHDLDRLALSWTGSASRAYADRLDEVASYMQRLADESDAIRTGLLAMSAALRETQRLAEQPEAVVVPERTFDSVLAGALGYQMTPEESANARERMVHLVAGLAAQYGVVDHGTWPAAITPAPDGLLGPATSLAGARPAHAAGTGLLAAEIGPMHGAVIPAAGGDPIPTTGAAPANLGTSGPVTSLTGTRAASGPSGQSDVADGGRREDGRTGGAFAGQPAGQPAGPMVGPAMAARPADAHPADAHPAARAGTDELDWYTNDRMPWADKADDSPPPVLG